MKFKVKIWLTALIITVFFAFSAFSVLYCKAYRRNPFPGQESQPVILELAAVNCGKIIGTLKSAAAEYSASQRNIRIFVLPLTKDQAQTFTAYDLLLSFENDRLYGFITTQEAKEQDAARSYINLLAQSYEIQVLI